MEPIEPIDLCVPIYLNQKIIFDVLAMLEDGFSNLNTIKISASESESQKSGYGGSVGASNVFAFLGITLKGERGKEKGAQEQRESTVEKVHTPASLFFKLRSILDGRSLIEKVEALEDVESLSSGQFVEFRAVLRKNPLVEYLETFIQVLGLADLVPDQINQSSQGNKPGGKGKGKQAAGARPSQGPHKQMRQQMEAVLATLTESGSLEIIGEMLDALPARSVLSTNLEYFNDRDASEIIDGEFWVLGKVVRVIDSESESSINLLRKTTFGKFGSASLDELSNRLESVGDSPIDLPEFTTRIEGPAIQVIPVAVFV